MAIKFAKNGQIEKPINEKKITIKLLFVLEEKFLYLRINVEIQKIKVLVCNNELIKKNIKFFKDIYFSFWIEFNERNHNKRANPSLICTWILINKKADKVRDINNVKDFNPIFKLFTIIVN